MPHILRIKPNGKPLAHRFIPSNLTTKLNGVGTLNLLQSLMAKMVRFEVWLSKWYWLESLVTICNVSLRFLKHIIITQKTLDTQVSITFWYSYCFKFLILVRQNIDPSYGKFTCYSHNSTSHKSNPLFSHYTSLYFLSASHAILVHISHNNGNTSCIK